MAEETNAFDLDIFLLLQRQEIKGEKRMGNSKEQQNKEKKEIIISLGSTVDNIHKIIIT